MPIFTEDLPIRRFVRFIPISRRSMIRFPAEAMGGAAGEAEAEEAVEAAAAEAEADTAFKEKR